MKGEAQNLLYFFSEDIILEVPFFQRPYVWNEKNWKDLYDSIIEEKQCRMPFMGSFIFQSTKNDDKKFLVIDGQQRITTISILVKALMDKIGDTLESTIKAKFLSIIFRTEYTPDLKPLYTPRLNPSAYDKPGYDLVMSEIIDIEKIKSNNDSIVQAYLYFIGIFDKLTHEELLALGSKLLTNYKFFLIISLGIDDNEQKIFDSVNNFGQRLTCADSIKNYLYQQLRNFDNDEIRQKEVMEIYKKNWDEPFYLNGRKDFWYEEKNLGKQNVTNLEEFLKDFATIKGFYKASISGNLSEAYKTYINKLSYDELKTLTLEMKEYANCYHDMINDYKDLNDCRISDVTNTTLLILNELDSTTFTPVVLYLYKNKPTNYELVFKALQKFVLMRLIYNLSTKNYNKIAEVLLEKKSVQDAVNYLNEYNANSSINLRDYPSGLAFIKQNNKANLILFLIEMIKRNKDGEDKYADTLIYNKSLEHILPLKWKKWALVPCYDYNADGDYVQITKEEDIKEIRDFKKYSIGNMTLLNGSLNSSIGNDVFEVKINGKVTRKQRREGIKKFVGTLNVAREIVETYNKQHKWDERDINERAESLFMVLNDYFKFTDAYVKQKKSIIYTESNLYEIENDSILDELNDDFLLNEDIGVVVRESMKYLMKKNMLTDSDINELMDQKFSSTTFGCSLPALTIEVEAKNRKRYYSDALFYKGKEYLLCKEVYKEDRDSIVSRIKSKIKANNYV